MIRAKLVVFPVRGRNWCFSRSVSEAESASSACHTPSTFKKLWNTFSSSNKPAANAELLADFVSNKMNKAWTALEKAPDGTAKKKLHGLGLRLLARVKPSEIFLKSISKEVTNLQVTFPSSLNSRLVRRRLRHVAIRGAIIHKKYFYGSVVLLPLTTALSVLPLPNVPFFWILFRSYSHWRALKGSEKLLELVSDGSEVPNVKEGYAKRENTTISPVGSPLLVMLPSKELEGLIAQKDGNGELSRSAVLDICKAFDLNVNDVLKYRKSV
ncbi:hypothetical protein ACFE04_003790 [Oxalis oulophora]